MSTSEIRDSAYSTESQTKGVNEQKEQRKKQIVELHVVC